MPLALGNQTNEDIWINIPEMATNAYITNLAQLIDYGSDGVKSPHWPIGQCHISRGKPQSGSRERAGSAGKG